MDPTPTKQKKKLISTITSDEDDIRFRIYAGEIPLWEAARERVRRAENFQGPWREGVKRSWEETARVEKNLREIARGAREDSELDRQRRLRLVESLERIKKQLKLNAEDVSMLFKATELFAYKEMEHRILYRSLRETNSILYKEIDLLEDKIKNYCKVIKYLHKELTMERTGHPTVPYVESTKSIHRVLYSKQGVDSIMDNIIDLKEHVMNKEKLKVGTDSGITQPIDWLSELEADTVFICEPIHPNDPNPLLQEYVLIFKGEKGIKLLANLNEPEVYVWVNPKKFCAIYQLVEILGMNPNGE